MDVRDIKIADIKSVENVRIAVKNLNGDVPYLKKPDFIKLRQIPDKGDKKA